MALATLAQASSHREAPLLRAVSDGELGDLTDLYAWMSADASKLELVLGWAPDAAAGSGFSDEVQWAFHLTSRASMTAGPGKDATLVCTFDVEQQVSCWLGDEYLHGDASTAGGIASASGKLRVFAGHRDDPFFFNQTGFRAAAPMIAAHAADAADAAGCPTLEAADGAGIAAQLAHGAVGAAPADDFAGQEDVLALAVEVDKSLVDSGGPVLGVWASTHRAPGVTP
ncbi:MAG: DUF4331 family protein [Myxococcota bacterium]